jgi:uncharacterized membrane protein
MTIINFALIVVSSFFHAFYNFLMRKKSGNQLFLCAIFIAAFFITLADSLISGGYSNIPWYNVPYIYGAAFFYVLYQVFVNKSYESGGNISINYPLSVLSHLFIPVWAFFILGEKISVITTAGICVTVIGALALQIRELSFKELFKIFTMSKEYTGARYALAASFFYSFGAIFDKYRISSFTASTYLLFMIGFMVINMITMLIVTKKFTQSSKLFSNWKIIAVGGAALFLSFMTFRIALQETPVSIAVPIRQTSVIFAVLFGVIFLKENFKIEKVAAVIITITGVILINYGI